jgi:hypothetical protein
MNLRSVSSSGWQYLKRARRLIQRGTDAASEQPAQPTYAGPFSAVVPARLARAPIRELPAAVSDKAHQRVRDQAMSWQQVAGHATFWEMAAQEADEGYAYALAGQMASAGEQLALAYAASVEVALWQENLEPDGPEVAREMGMRAMAEAQSLFVIGTGHALANVAVRALSLRQDLKAHLIETFFSGNVAGSFDPFSSERSDWLSMNKPTCKKLRKVTQLGDSQEITDLIEPVINYGLGQTWNELVERRGEDFHRWRPQTHGLQGVPRRSPWHHDPTSRSLGIGTPIYEDAKGLAAEVGRLASEAMLELAGAMESFYSAWPAASSVLGGPMYQVSAERGDE